jgi:hypothetical protein
MIQMKIRIIAAGVVAHPGLSVYVGHVGMAGFVAVVWLRICWLGWTLMGRWSAPWNRLMWGGVMLRECWN